MNQNEAIAWIKVPTTAWRARKVVLLRTGTHIPVDLEQIVR
jgi:hypothetical protein